MWMPAYCKSNFKVGTIADETIRPHDFKCMVTNQIGPNAAEVSDYIPYVICEFLLYIFAMVFWKSAAFRDSHHVFVDMFLLRKRYPALFRMMADKEQQQNFYQQRQREIPAGSVNGSRMPGRNLQWTKRLGAYGEDCHIRDLRQVVKLVNQPNCEWTEKRVRFLLFEQLLQNSDEFQKAMKAAGITSSLAHPLVTIRIWTKRFVEEDWVAALLVGPEDEEISNSKANQCFVVDKNEFTIRGGKGGNKGGTGGGNGKTIAVPYFAEMLETALWAHDQTPQLPMLGTVSQTKCLLLF
eukprot:g4816.t1